MTSFDPQSLAGAAGVDPWALLKKLEAGDPAQIESLAAAFYQAAGKMSEAHAATEQSQSYVKQGYQVQGAAPLDVNAEAQQTKASISDGKDRLPQIAKVLSTVAGDLRTATTKSASEISTLNAAIQKYETEWAAFYRNTGHHLPEDEWAPVLQGYVNDAVSAVKTHGATVQGYVTDYESTLGDSLKSMADLGYIPPDALDEGPGDVSLTPAKAQADAQLLLNGENSQPPGPGGIQQIQQAEETVALLNAKISAGDKLSADEQAYLDAFYNKVGPDGLAKLTSYVNAAANSYPGDGGADPAVQQQLRTELVRPVADGIMNLSNPAVNADGQSHVPKAVTELENTPIGYRDPNTGIVWANKDAMGGGNFDHGFTVDGAATYNGFADLMGNADVTGGTDFTKSLGESAIRVKQQLNTIAGTEMHLIQRDPMAVNTDSSHPMTSDQMITLLKGATDDSHVGEMLGVVAHNGDASAQMLIDTHDREAILGMNWDNAQGGAASIIHAGTDRNVPVAQQAEHATAALDVMTELGGDRTAYEAHVTKGVDAAVLDMANQYIDTFAQPVDPHLQHSSVESLSDPVGADRTGVMLTDADRKHFLEYLMHGDGNAVKFHAAADGYSQDQLARAFQTNDPNLVQEVMTRAGALDGSITKADFHDQLDIVTDHDKQQAAAYAAAQHRAEGLQFWEGMATNGGGLVVDAATGGAASPIVSLATPVVDELFKQATDPGNAPVAQLPRSEAQLNDATDESYQLHRDYLIASAAHQAGLPVDASVLDPSGTMLPYNKIGADGQPSDQLTDLYNTVYNLDKNHGADRQSFDSQYQAQVNGNYWDDRGPVGNVDQNGWRTGDTARAMLYGNQNWQIISHNPVVDLDHEWPDDPGKLYQLP